MRKHRESLLLKNITSYEPTNTQTQVIAAQHSIETMQRLNEMQKEKKTNCAKNLSLILKMPSRGHLISCCCGGLITLCWCEWKTTLQHSHSSALTLHCSHDCLVPQFHNSLHAHSIRDLRIMSSDNKNFFRFLSPSSSLRPFVYTRAILSACSSSCSSSAANTFSMHQSTIRRGIEFNAISLWKNSHFFRSLSLRSFGHHFTCNANSSTSNWIVWRLFCCNFALTSQTRRVLYNGQPHLACRNNKTKRNETTTEYDTVKLTVVCNTWKT